MLKIVNISSKFGDDNLFFSRVLKLIAASSKLEIPVDIIKL